jgi:hypothetical protein
MSAPASLARRLAATVVFAIAMGWLEGVVVVYIRGLLGITVPEGYGTSPEILARMRAIPWLLPTEQTREVATIAMLAAVGYLAADRFRARFGVFLICFGVWDITYYVALYAILRWPPSLATMDVLFLIPPGPWWNQPVWVPVLISCGLIALGVRLFLGGRAADQPPDRPGLPAPGRAPEGGSGSRR